MKLVTLLILVTTCAANELNVPQANRPQFTFPIQFQSPQGPFVSESNLYLPPETQTQIPYFPKNSNELQYQYLPATGTKAPSRYPPLFPNFSTLTPKAEEDEDEDEDDRPFYSSTSGPFDKFNHSQNSPGPQMEIPNRPIPKTMPYFDQIDRIDTKYPAQIPNAQINFMATASPFNFQPQIARRMTQTPPGMAGNHQNEQMMPDQQKSASFHGPQFLPPPPQGYNGPTPEAIPILRLSNEMDLDGSYSYEALSADQTHVMQHGHVENAGTDQAENVVEGSYSYVGDNGQTYTVHYIADANGFRASGDHLPVPPPVPEIIQRSIDYNIAEESRSPETRTNFNEEKNSHNQQRQYFNHQHPLPPPMHFNHQAPPMVQPPMIQPPLPRNLFLGRQPEAFSQKPNGASSTQSNNLQPSASTQTPVVHYEAPKDGPGPSSPSPSPATANGAPISPQVTFLASQGAHDPAQSISRVYAQPNIEGPIFRFANMNNRLEPYKPEFRTRWQYQNPFQHESVTKIPAAKNFISRSSVDHDDDVMINFSEMTPEQYSRMYHSKINPQDNLYDKLESKEDKFNHKSTPSNQERYEEEKFSRELPVTFYGNNIPKTYQNYNQVQLPFPQNWYSNMNQYQAYNTGAEGRTVNNEHRSSLITKDTFVPPSQTVTGSYDYQNDIHEAKQMQNEKNTTPPQYVTPVPITTDSYKYESIDNNATFHEIYKISKPKWPQTEPNYEPIQNQSLVQNTTPQSSFQNEQQQFNNYNDQITKPTYIHKATEPTQQLQQKPTSYNDQITKPNHIYRQPEPLITIADEQKDKTTSTEQSINNILESNIFLKNLMIKNVSQNNSSAKVHDGWRPSQSYTNKIEERKDDKEVKMLAPKSQTHNDITEINKKSIDLAQVANLVTLKKYFESNKIKPKSKQEYSSANVQADNQKEQPKNLLDHSEQNKKPKVETYYKSNNYVNGNTVQRNPEVERILGVAKIYKTLQRNSKQDGYGPPQLRTELVPPVQDLKMSNLQRTQAGLPPLGRAGPSMKSYLPPVFS